MVPRLLLEAAVVAAVGAASFPGMWEKSGKSYTVSLDALTSDSGRSLVAQEEQERFRPSSWSPRQGLWAYPAQSEGNTWKGTFMASSRWTSGYMDQGPAGRTARGLFDYADMDTEEEYGEDVPSLSGNSADAEGKDTFVGNTTDEGDSKQEQSGEDEKESKQVRSREIEGKSEEEDGYDSEEEEMSKQGGDDTSEEEEQGKNESGKRGEEEEDKQDGEGEGEEGQSKQEKSEGREEKGKQEDGEGGEEQEQGKQEGGEQGKQHDFKASEDEEQGRQQSGEGSEGQGQGDVRRGGGKNEQQGHGEQVGGGGGSKKQGGRGNEGWGQRQGHQQRGRGKNRERGRDKEGKRKVAVQITEGPERVTDIDSARKGSTEEETGKKIPSGQTDEVNRYKKYEMKGKKYWRDTEEGEETSEYRETYSQRGKIDWSKYKEQGSKEVKGKDSRGNKNESEESEESKESEESEASKGIEESGGRKESEERIEREENKESEESQKNEEREESEESEKNKESDKSIEEDESPKSSEKSGEYWKNKRSRKVKREVSSQYKPGDGDDSFLSDSGILQGEMDGSLEDDEWVMVARWSPVGLEE